MQRAEKSSPHEPAPPRTPDPKALLRLVWPSLEYLASYIEALERGWSPDSLRGESGPQAALARIRKDPEAYLDKLVDREAKAGPVQLPDGSTAERLPGYRRWIWDGAFCGHISLRWRPGSSDLPPHCLGHIGYAVVPWKRRQGYATEALRLILTEARAEGLAFVEITTDLDNIASRRVIEANGALLFERFFKPPQYGDAVEALRYRIQLD
jgi:predicted acetyltransferase